MTQLNSFEARVLRDLCERIAALRRETERHLSLGKARGPDAATTAQNYVELVGYLRALSDVEELCQQVEDNLLGRGKS